MQSENKRFGIALTVAFLVGLLLRLLLTLALSIRVEESLQWLYASQLSLVLEGTQPPLFPLLLAGWLKLFGDSLLAMRLVSVLVGATGIVVCGLVARQIAGESFGIIVSFLCATNPLLVHIGSLAEPYALLLFFMPLSFSFLVSLADAGAADPLKLSFLAGTMLLGVFTHYYFIAIIPLMFLYLIVFRRSELADARILRPLSLSLGISLGGILLYSPIAWSQAKRYLDQLSSNQSALRFPVPKIIGWFEQTSPLAAIENPSWLGPVFAWVAFLLLCFGAYLSIRRRRNIDPMPHFLFTFPFVLLTAVSVAVPLINEHFIWFLLPGCLFFIALGIMGLGKWRWVAISLLSLAGVFGLIWSSFGAPYAWKSPPDWKGLSEQIVTVAEPGDVLLLNPAWTSVALDYHLNRTRSSRGTPANELPIVSFESMKSEENVDINKALLICVHGYDCHPWRTLLKEREFTVLDRVSLYGLQFEQHQRSAKTNLPEE